VERAIANPVAVDRPDQELDRLFEVVGSSIGVDPRPGRLELAGLQMAAGLGHDSARVQRRRPHPARLMPPVEIHREQDVVVLDRP
jgi:hypothetical protein